MNTHGRLFPSLGSNVSRDFVDRNMPSYRSPLFSINVAVVEGASTTEVRMPVDKSPSDPLHAPYVGMWEVTEARYKTRPKGVYEPDREKG
jgi:hypothetical protein